MTKQLYYDDPLIAAYMIRDFGVKYYTVDYGDSGGMDIVDDYDNLLDEYTSSCEDSPNLFIHPDSLDIFKPQIGDLVMWNRYIGCVEPIIKDGIKSGYITLKFSDCLLSGDIQSNKIIQRNGKQFFMPKEVQDD